MAAKKHAKRSSLRREVHKLSGQVDAIAKMLGQCLPVNARVITTSDDETFGKAKARSYADGGVLKLEGGTLGPATLETVERKPKPLTVSDFEMHPFNAAAPYRVFIYQAQTVIAQSPWHRNVTTSVKWLKKWNTSCAPGSYTCHVVYGSDHTVVRIYERPRSALHRKR